MSTYKEYRNDYNEIVTAQQVEQLQDFKESTYIENRLKKIVNYWDREIQYITLYIYPDEDVNTVLSAITDMNIEYLIAKDLEEINGYKVWKYYDFQNGVLATTNFYTEVFDSENRRMAYKSEDSGNVSKIWYLEGKHVFHEEEELDFYYEDEEISFDFENGQLKIHISFAPEVGSFSNIDLLRGYNDLQLPFLTEEIITYFTNPEPLVPNVNI